MPKIVTPTPHPPRDRPTPDRNWGWLMATWADNHPQFRELRVTTSRRVRRGARRYPSEASGGGRGGQRLRRSPPQGGGAAPPTPERQALSAARQGRTRQESPQPRSEEHTPELQPLK